MKSASALIFATAVAADYGYGAASTSTTSSKLGYTTMYPGHGKAPVTVTAQYQPVPTYVNGQWSEYECLTSVIDDNYGNKVTVTRGDQDITMYHTKKTIKHTTTVYGVAKPTGYGAPEYATKTWEELSEKIIEIPFNKMGPHAIKGFPGYPKFDGKKDEQPVNIKSYAGGKWSTWAHTWTYAAPKPAATTYTATGVYTYPANDITVAYPTHAAYPTVYHAEANKPCTYGGQFVKVDKPTTITAYYGAYETSGPSPDYEVKSKVITCDKAGEYTVVKPTTTVYDHDTEISYPTVTKYPAGVYHHPAETVTCTKPGQEYTASYSKTATYDATYPTSKPSGTTPYPADPSADNDYEVESYGKASAGYVKRGGVLQRRKAEPVAAKAAAKHVILV